jgi:hypothetical protein
MTLYGIESSEHFSSISHPKEKRKFGQIKSNFFANQHLE